MPGKGSKNILPNGTSSDLQRYNPFKKKTHPSQIQHHFQGEFAQTKNTTIPFGPAQNAPVHSGSYERYTLED